MHEDTTRLEWLEEQFRRPGEMELAVRDGFFYLSVRTRASYPGWIEFEGANLRLVIDRAMERL